MVIGLAHALNAVVELIHQVESIHVNHVVLEHGLMRGMESAKIV